MGVAPAIILRKEKDLVAHFRNARALSPDSAQSLGALRVDEEAIALRRLRNRAVIRQGGPGTYYLDEPSWEALGRIRRRLMLVALILLLGATALALTGAWHPFS